jgi:hypothetical protein
LTLLLIFLPHGTAQAGSDSAPSSPTISTIAFYGIVNVNYTGRLSASGGTPPYTWAQLSGELPPGLFLSSSGTVSGTPTIEGSYAFTVEVEDATGLSASRSYDMSIGGQLQAGCGSFTDNSTCGNVGDPYEGHGPPSNQQPISGCTTISKSSTNYKLSGNIGSDPTAACLTIDYNVHDMSLDLGGFTVTGAIFDHGAGNGNIIFNGTVTCNRNTSAYPQSCVNAYFNYGGGPPTTEQYRLHHLTVNQQNQNGVQIQIEADLPGKYSGGGSGLGMPCRIDHTSWDSSAISPPPDGTDSRYGATRQIGYCNVEYDDNYIHCGGAPLNACQGIGGAITSYAHNNEVLMDNLVDALSGRAFDCDAGAGVGGTCDIYNNYVVAMHNRAVRYRICTIGLSCAGVQNGNVYGNQILNIQQGGRAGTIHIGETDVALEHANIQVYGNTLELNPSTAGGTATPGNGIVVAGAEGVTIHDNIVTCYGGNCAGAGYVLTTDTWPYAGDVTSATIKNTTLTSGWGSNAAVMVCGPGNPTQYNCTDDPHGVASVTYCNTGTVVGTGKITKSCP